MNLTANASVGDGCTLKTVPRDRSDARMFCIASVPCRQCPVLVPHQKCTQA